MHGRKLKNVVQSIQRIYEVANTKSAARTIKAYPLDFCCKVFYPSLPLLFLGMKNGDKLYMKSGDV